MWTEIAAIAVVAVVSGSVGWAIRDKWTEWRERKNRLNKTENPDSN